MLHHLSSLVLFSVGLYEEARSAVVLVESGSTVPAPLYNRWTQECSKQNTNVQMRYLPVGTSEGIKQISHGAGDFAAGEAQLTEKDRKEGGLIELPSALRKPNSNHNPISTIIECRPEEGAVDDALDHI